MILNTRNTVCIKLVCMSLFHFAVNKQQHYLPTRVIFSEFKSQNEGIKNRHVAMYISSTLMHFGSTY